MKITKAQIEASYEIAKKVYEASLSKKNGADILHEQHGMNVASALDFIEIYRCMRNGALFQRTMNVEATRYYLNQIKTQSGTESLSHALASIRLHIAYYENLQKINLNSIREVVKNFEGQAVSFDMAGLPFSDEQKKILDSVMPGGEKWSKYVSAGGSCLKSCPYYSTCRGKGPDKACSDKWRSSERTPDVLAVMFHVMNNFEHYNRGDIIPSAGTVLPELRRIVSEAQLRQADEEFEEGSLRLKMHHYRERNSEAARQLKREALSKGNLVCESCNINYYALYGEKAIRVVECHHEIPISSKEHGGKTKKSDLKLLCANCHRLAHSTTPPIPIDELTSLVNGKA